MTSEGEIFKGSYDTSEIPKDALAGTSVSGGIVEGYVRVILDPKKETLQKGEILVTKFADPGWTPLFVIAGGMALEVGGTMTHSAIVAREYNIPAVVGIENVTEKLKTGDFVRINADKGYIERVKAE